MFGDVLKNANESLDKALSNKKQQQDFMRLVALGIVDVLKPVIEQLATDSKLSKEEFIQAIRGIKVDIPPIEVPKATVDVQIPSINVPEAKVTVTVPEIKIPTPQVTVNVPEIKLPVIQVPEVIIPPIKVPKAEVTVKVDNSKIKFPEIIFPTPDASWLEKMGITLTNPLPVQIRDAHGKPIDFSNLGSRTVVTGGGGPTQNLTSIAKQVAFSSLKTKTLSANGDLVENIADLDGAKMVRSSAPLGDLISERISDTSGTSTNFANFSAVVGTKNYCRGYSVFNSSATAGFVDIRDGSGGSVLWTIPLPAGGGANIVSSEPLFKGSANTAFAYDVSAGLTTVYISLTGFQSKI